MFIGKSRHHCIFFMRICIHIKHLLSNLILAAQHVLSHCFLLLFSVIADERYIRVNCQSYVSCNRPCHKCGSAMSIKFTFPGVTMINCVYDWEVWSSADSSGTMKKPLLTWYPHRCFCPLQHLTDNISSFFLDTESGETLCPGAHCVFIPLGWGWIVSALPRHWPYVRF